MAMAEIEKEEVMMKTPWWEWVRLGYIIKTPWFDWVELVILSRLPGNIRWDWLYYQDSLVGLGDIHTF